MNELTLLYIGKFDTTAAVLQTYATKVIIAQTCEEGRDLLSKHAIDAMIVECTDDMSKPLDTIERIKSVRKHLLSVIITANPDRESLIRAISLGVNELIIHPYNTEVMDQLFKKLRYMVMMNTQLSQKNLLLNQYKNALDASLIISKTDTNGTITYVNDKFCDITGYEPSELIGKTHRLFKHPETTKKQMEDLWNTIHAKKVWHSTIANLNKSGKTFYTDTFIIPILNDKYHIIEFMDMRIDITEIKNYLRIIQAKVDEATQAIQAQQQQLISQSRAAALGEMFDNIAHQWRQPIAAINNAIINAEFAMELGEMNEGKILKTFEQINTYTAFLSKTIDDFRNFSNPSKEKTLFSLYESIHQTINIIQGAYEMNHITLEYEPDKALRKLTIYGPQGELSQVILNILSNARDAIKEKQVANAHVRIDLSATDDALTISIADNAGGIPSEVLPKIFDPYFSTKGNAQGSGIGLYMSKTIIEKHFEGRLEAFNEEGGATFTITLPIV